MGGAAGGGKSWSLLMEGVRHHRTPGFSAVMFRRTTIELRNRGGLWSESHRFYGHPKLGGVSRESPMMEWRFPAGAVVQFAHLEHDKTVHAWQGAQVTLIGFDELTTFSAAQFWYLLSRNRSTCGVRPYVRATTNPDADSWVAELVDWWIDPETGYAIPERSGVIRWFVRVGDQLMWADDPADLANHTDVDGEPIPPKSFTFIPARLEDNQILTQADPGYRATLMALDTVNRERLRYGNWKIRPSAGMYFRRDWIGELQDAAPAGLQTIRAWDLASTEPRPGSDPDWTVGFKIGRGADGRYWLLDCVYDRRSPGGVEQLIKATAAQDGRHVPIALPQDPGAGGKMTAAYMARQLAGYDCRYRPITGDKITRFSPFSAQCQAGNVVCLRGPWNEYVFRELSNFPPDKTHGHDDVADAISLGFDFLTRRGSTAATSRYVFR